MLTFTSRSRIYTAQFFVYQRYDGTDNVVYIVVHIGEESKCFFTETLGM